MRYVTVYLMYAAVLIRGLAWYDRTPLLGPAVAIMMLCGGLLILDQLIYERRVLLPARALRVYPFAYLAVQTSLVDALLLLPPRIDFSAILFIPLSMQAGLWFQRRAGYISIATLSIFMAAGLLMGPEGTLTAISMTLLYAAACFLVGSYANMVKTAVIARAENLRLYDELKQADRQLLDYTAQVEELAVARERAHLSRELHDSITQTVFSMTLALQTARVLWDRDRSRVKAQLDRLQELARSAVGEIQVLVSQLRPDSLAGTGLAAALARECDERRERNGLLVQCRVNSECPLPEPVAVGLFRIVHEALSNVVKHAGTQQATITLDLALERPYVEVADEGVGFDAGHATQQIGHMGLIGMAERARELGWELTVQSQPGRGTCVRVEAGTAVGGRADEGSPTEGTRPAGRPGGEAA